MDITLKVQPEVLTSKAGDLQSERSTVQQLMEDAKAQISSLTGEWISDASETFQSKFKQTYDDIDAILAIIQEYITNLTEAASIYTDAERNATSAAEGLPVDGVFGV